jgi:hypothetical protein
VHAASLIGAFARVSPVLAIASRSHPGVGVAEQEVLLVDEEGQQGVLLVFDSDSRRSEDS